MKTTLALILIGLSAPISAWAQLNPNIIMGIKPIQIDDPMNTAIKAQQLRLLQIENQKRQLELEERAHPAEAPAETETSTDDAVSRKAHGTVLITRTNGQTTKFEFSEGEELNLDTGSKMSKCSVVIKSVKDNRYVELNCFPLTGGKKLFLYQFRSFCGQGAGSMAFQGGEKKATDAHTITFGCES